MLSHNVGLPCDGKMVSGIHVYHHLQYIDVDYK